jgi:hypothetical protein
MKVCAPVPKLLLLGLFKPPEVEGILVVLASVGWCAKISETVSRFREREDEAPFSGNGL